MKILNAGKFVLTMAENPGGVAAVTNPVDLAMLAGLRAVVEAATRSFDEFDYTGALEATESFFWSFCDDYLELVKERAYGAHSPAEQSSAQAALALALDVQLRLFAPILPFVTEEVWRWTNETSVHLAPWPTVDELPSGDATLLADVATALIAIRGAKSTAKVSMKAEVSRAAFSGPAAVVARLRTIEADLRAVGRLVGEVTWADVDAPLGVEVELAEQV